MTPTTKQYIDAVESAKLTLKDAEHQLAEHRSRRKIFCLGCKKLYEIRKLKLIVTHWSSDHNDDCWKEGEWRFACPKDGALNRLLFRNFSVDYTKRNDIGVAAEPTFKHIYRDLFISRTNTYDRDDPAAWNNYYVDDNRERFELPLDPRMK